MLNISFKNYMEMNVQFNYLKGYYNSVDFASIYGVEKMEIKHSNFLKWLLEPKKNTDEKAIEYLPIRRLLKLLQNNSQYYDYLNSVNIDYAIIKNVKVMREKHNIDLLIILEINNENYVIVIENKLESLIHDDQLKIYKDAVLNKYKSYKPLFVFLHPGFEINSDQKQEVQKYKYIPITYQEIYDNILKDVLEFSNSSETKLIVRYYIHSLACYSSDNIQGLIVTDQGRKCLMSLFGDEQILKMIDSLYNNEKNEYTEFYRENKMLFIQIFNKYDTLYIDEDKFKVDQTDKVYSEKIDCKTISKSHENFDNLSKKINIIMAAKTYILNGENYSGIGELLRKIFDILLENHEPDELKDLIDLYPESVPLLIEKHEIDNLKTKMYKSWYLNNPKIVEKGNKIYYVLSAWSLKEYEDLKERINELSKDNSDIYGNITLE